MSLIPKLAFELVKRWEGLEKRVWDQGRLWIAPYFCPAGYPTIGYGHLLKSIHHPRITVEQAEALLEKDLTVALAGLLSVSPRLWYATDGQVSALLDFVFNLGITRYKASTLKKRVDAGNWAGAQVELRKWVWAGSGTRRRKLQGLIARREAEIKLLLR
jgi:lysozyme